MLNIGPLELILVLVILALVVGGVVALVWFFGRVIGGAARDSTSQARIRNLETRVQELERDRR